MIGPELALVVAVASGGLATVLLRQAVVGGRTDEARFHRAAAQTVCVVGGVLLLLGPAGIVPFRTGAAFAALNGAFGAVAFILFSKGLETVEASTGKPALVVSMVVAAGLGIVLLGEGVSVPKLAGIGLVGAAVFLLAGD